MEFPPAQSGRSTTSPTEPERARRLADAFAAALPSSDGKWRDLHNAVRDFVRAEKRAGRAPEEVLVSIKEILQQGRHLAVQDRVLRQDDVFKEMEAFKDRLVRACIDAYYTDD